MIALMGKRKNGGKEHSRPDKQQMWSLWTENDKLKPETNMCSGKDRVGDEIKRHKLATYLCRIYIARKDEDENRGGKDRRKKRVKRGGGIGNNKEENFK